ncbi:glycosyltransferase family 4 protein [Brevibacillus thermoruber]|uniref:glycosyltransferase family 4 protein n=1 Tax=Brevibacillus thermoruber TaxID=33942 RepID=UPI000422E6BB|nr:glycosyltransferase family 4 protein [Brevibacillus thermoruber]
MIQVAYMSTYVPKKCGLATYTHHLRHHVKQAKLWNAADPVIVMADENEQGYGNNQALWPLAKHDREAYRAMAQRVNESGVSVVSLQHEFGIFGGEAGAYVLDFVRELKKPLVTTFHTVFASPQEPYRSIQREIAERSDRIVVMNRRAVGYLRQSFGIPEENIVFIPHGTPVPNPQQREAVRQRLNWADKKVMMTFGLLSRGKGLELILEALPQAVKEVPNLLYAVVGQTHPEVKKREGEAYREELMELIRRNRLERHVVMIDRYVDEEELVQFLTACDLYVTPYPGMEQITSGTLAYAVGLGRPVLSTPYSYAQDLLEGCDELLIPYGERERWAEKIAALLRDDSLRRDWEAKIGRIGSAMHWPQIGKRYASLFVKLSKQSGSTFEQTEGTPVAALSR